MKGTKKQRPTSATNRLHRNINLSLKGLPSNPPNQNIFPEGVFFLISSPFLVTKWKKCWAKELLLYIENLLKG